MLVFYSGFLFQRVNKVLHWERTEKILSDPMYLIWDFLTRRNLFVLPFIPKGVIVGRFTQTKIKVKFPLLYFMKKICRTAQLISQNNPFYQKRCTNISAGSFSIAKVNKRINFFTKKERLSCCNADGIEPFIVCRWKISQLQKKNLEYAKEVFGLTEYSEEEENKQSSKFPKKKNSNDHTSMLIPKAVSILVP